MRAHGPLMRSTFRGGSNAEPAEADLKSRIFQRLVAEAEDVAHREGAIAGYIVSAIIKHASLRDVIIYRLAARLAHPDLPRDLLRQIFTQAATADPSIEDSIASDLMAIADRDPACRRFLEPVLYFKGFHAIQTHRLAHALWLQGRSELARYVQSRSSSIFQTDIHPSATLGRGLLLDHATGLVVAGGVVIDDDVSLLHNVSLVRGDGVGTPTIRRGVSIGAGSKILGGIEIGSCVRVAAGSVLSDSVPPQRTVAGSPARIVAVAHCMEPTRNFDELLASKLEFGPHSSQPAVL